MFKLTKKAYTNFRHEKKLKHLSTLPPLLASFISFEYTLPLIRVYTPHPCGTLPTALSLYIVQNAAYRVKN